MKLKNIRQGLAVYKTDQSRFWFLRMWNPLTKKYIRKSTKEETRIDAIEAAIEFADHYNPIQQAAVEAKRVSKLSFEHYARQLDKSHKDDWKRLNRAKDGLLAHFGKMDVTTITTAKIREYIVSLDANREKPLAASTKKKHCFSLTKVLNLAHEDGSLSHLPKMPAIKTEDNPRPSFNDQELKLFYTVLNDMIWEEQDAEKKAFMEECYAMFHFIGASFLRPVETELFGIKWNNITRSVDPDSLMIEIKGKTGHRTVWTLRDGILLFDGRLQTSHKHAPADYYFLPDIENRTTAVRKVNELFNSVCDHPNAKLRYDQHGNKRTVYSLRHTALQSYIRDKGDNIELYSLAKNAGTSVQMLERFYLKRMGMTKEMVRRMQA